MSENDQRRPLLIATIVDKAVLLGGQLSDMNRAKLDNLNLAELEKVANEVEMAKTAFNVGLMVSQAAAESVHRQRTELEANTSPTKDSINP